jgi:hypothetical protein
VENLTNTKIMEEDCLSPEELNLTLGEILGYKYWRSGQSLTYISLEKPPNPFFREISKAEVDFNSLNKNSLPNFSRDLNAIMKVIRELDCETLYKFGHNLSKRTKSLGSEEASRAKLAPQPWELCLVLIKTLNEKNLCAK